MVEHALIPDEDRHEVKHASTAVIGQALVSQGDGTTRFQYYDYNDLINTPAASGYKQILYAASSASAQTPTATDTALQVEFGTAQSNADVSLSASGTLTFLKEGNYIVVLFMRIGRTLGAGVANLFSRLVYNGTQVLNSNAAKLPDQEHVTPFSATIPMQVTANATLRVDIMRDSSGANNGGLYQISPAAAGWNTCPSASIVVYKLSSEA